jgi:hypothetical protein
VTSKVWSDSTRETIEFPCLSRKEAAKLWHRARDFDRKTHEPGKHGGALGPNAMAVLHALIFDFHNCISGQLDPSLAAIARAANVCERSVVTALKRLRDNGVVDWVRRCWSRWRDGRHELEQRTNAYALLPPQQWRGYKPPPEPAPPWPEAWGARPALAPQLDLAAEESRTRGHDMRSVLRQLDCDRPGSVAEALARLGKAMSERKP